MMGAGVPAATSRSITRVWSLWGIVSGGAEEEGGEGSEVERPFAEVGDTAGKVTACFVAGVDDGFDIEVWKGIADKDFEVLER